MKAGRELDDKIDVEIFGYPSLRQYSTQIADAWLVVEKWDKYEIAWDGYRFIAQVANDEDAAWSLGIADTAPLAICLAALKAVEK